MERSGEPGVLQECSRRYEPAIEADVLLREKRSRKLRQRDRRLRRFLKRVRRWLLQAPPLRSSARPRSGNGHPPLRERPVCPNRQPGNRQAALRQLANQSLRSWRERQALHTAHSTIAARAPTALQESERSGSRRRSDTRRWILRVSGPAMPRTTSFILADRSVRAQQAIEGPNQQRNVLVAAVLRDTEQKWLTLPAGDRRLDGTERLSLDAVIDADRFSPRAGRRILP